MRALVEVKDFLKIGVRSVAYRAGRKSLSVEKNTLSNNVGGWGLSWGAGILGWCGFCGKANLRWWDLEDLADVDEVCG